ncbi:phosphatidylinositol-specific phospholipase C [Nocardia transvalensis]|uniref:phosphatidylinositol-specific phospholipase C n=1 Tax=Nocardia transvalensis TaxID=37333 RepID=UPI001893CD5F|nr:phosphatidylinositol-specific phospholipase C domain-containing protein [Nocardia transvalensis]MBF6331623.1 phosphatidylinositol-specific phospholipase C domain-containing protein [Nocardia transvalensis]
MLRRLMIVLAAGAALTGCGVSASPPPDPTPSEAAVAAGLPGAAPSEAFGNLDAASNPDWMSALPDDTALSRLSIPGTHDTLSVHGGKAGPAVETQQSFPGDCPDPHCVTRQSLRVQLDAGIRALDIRLRRDKDGALAVHHGRYFQYASLDDVLTEVSDFLSRHERETVLLRLKNECTNTGAAFACADEGLVAPGLADYDRILGTHDRVWRPSATGRADIPPLREVRGKIVVIQFKDIDHGDERGLPLDEQDLWDNPGMAAKWAAISAHLDRAATADPRTLSVDYLSATGVPDPTKFPDRYARFENQHTLDYLRARPGTTTGVVMMDFPGPGLVSEIIRHNMS